MTYIMVLNNLLTDSTMIAIYFRDYDLNIVCGDICVDETLKCVATCEPTDSECLSICFRAQNACLESK